MPLINKLFNLSASDTKQNSSSKEDMLDSTLYNLSVDKRILCQLIKNLGNKVVCSGEIITNSPYNFKEKTWGGVNNPDHVVCDYSNPFHGRFFQMPYDAHEIKHYIPLKLSKKGKNCFFYVATNGYPDVYSVKEVAFPETYGKEFPSWESHPNPYYSKLNSLVSFKETKNVMLNNQVHELYKYWIKLPVISIPHLSTFCKRYNVEMTMDNMQNEENIISEYVRQGGGIRIIGCESPNAVGVDIPIICTVAIDENKMKEIGRLINKQYYEIGKEFYQRIRHSEALDSITPALSHYRGYDCDESFPGKTHAIMCSKTACNNTNFSTIGYTDLDSKSQMIGMIFAMLERKHDVSEAMFSAGLPMEDCEFSFDSFTGFTFGKKIENVTVLFNENAYSMVPFESLLVKREADQRNQVKKQELKEW